MSKRRRKRRTSATMLRVRDLFDYLKPGCMVVLDVRVYCENKTAYRVYIRYDSSINGYHLNEVPDAILNRWVCTFEPKDSNLLEITAM